MLNLMLNIANMAQLKIKNFFKKEDGAVDIVAIVVLIGIAVVLAVLFKDNITSLINSLFDKIVPNAENAVQ